MIIVIKQCTFHSMALPVLYFLVELEFGMLVFVEGGEPMTQRKTPGARTITNKNVNPEI